MEAGDRRKFPTTRMKPTSLRDIRRRTSSAVKTRSCRVRHRTTFERCKAKADSCQRKGEYWAICSAFEIHSRPSSERSPPVTATEQRSTPDVHQPAKQPSPSPAPAASQQPMKPRVNPFGQAAPVDTSTKMLAIAERQAKEKATSQSPSVAPSTASPSPAPSLVASSLESDWLAALLQVPVGTPALTTGSVRILKREDSANDETSRPQSRSMATPDRSVDAVRRASTDMRSPPPQYEVQSFEKPALSQQKAVEPYERMPNGQPQRIDSRRSTSERSETLVLTNTCRIV